MRRMRLAGLTVQDNTASNLRFGEMAIRPVQTDRIKKSCRAQIWSHIAKPLGRCSQVENNRKFIYCATVGLFVVAIVSNVKRNSYALQENL